MALLQAVHLLQGNGHGASVGLVDKAVVLAEFRAARTASQGYIVGNYTVEDVPPPGSEAPFPGLRPILLREMALGQRQQGRVLHGTLLETPFKMTGIMTILEDDAGDAITLAIYNAVRNSASMATTVEALGRYPEGRRVAVIEPHFKVSQNRQLIVRVDNPADIVDWGPAVQDEDDTRSEVLEVFDFMYPTE